MKNLIILAVVIALASFCMVAYAGKAEMPKDGRNTKMMFHAPDARKTVSLTVASQNINMSEDITWSASGAANCSFRTMSTATKVGPKKTLYANQWTTKGVRAGSAFTNFTGCTGWIVEIQ